MVMYRCACIVIYSTIIIGMFRYIIIIIYEVPTQILPITAGRPNFALIARLAWVLLVLPSSLLLGQVIHGDNI